MHDTTRPATRNVQLLLALLLLCGTWARADRIEDCTTVEGALPLEVQGYGIVTGLAGTGDEKGAVLDMIRKELGANRIPVALADLDKRNVAFVYITGTIPAFTQPGHNFDLTVTAHNGATNLQGGVLQQAHLNFQAGQTTVAVASGRVHVGTPTTSGRILAGGTLIKSEMLNQRYVDDQFRFRLILKRPNFTNAKRIAQTINTSPETNPSLRRQMGFRQTVEARAYAHAVSAGVVLVEIPEGFRRQKVEYISEVLNLDVPLQNHGMILINRQEGTVVITGSVQVQPGVISHRGRTIRIAEPVANEPIRYDLPDDADRALVSVPDPVIPNETLDNLVNTLNAMQMPTDEIAVILRKMKSAGMIQVDVLVE